MIDLSKGYLLSLDRDAAKVFFSTRSDDARITFLEERLNCDGPRCVDCRAEWKTLQQTLTSLAGNADSALDQAILGGRLMHEGPTHQIKLIRPDLVGVIAQQLAALSDDRVAATLLQVIPGTLVDDQTPRRAVLLELKVAVTELYREAAELGAAVVFVALNDGEM